MQYPLEMKFKILAIAPQIFVNDAAGAPICYVQQKLFKFKEHVIVYTDSSKSNTLCEIKADRMIDWSASYHFYDPSNATLGSVKRKGMRSIWRAHYNVFNESEQLIGSIREENPMAKVMDSILTEIPLVSLASGYMFNPRYLLTGATGTPLMRVAKKPAFLEGRFQIDKLAELDPVDELSCLMSFLMMVLLERRRG